MSQQTGTTYLIGAGPGATGLFTLRGVECLRRADVVLYDYLVNPQILQHASAAAELVCLGKHGASRVMPQVEINRRMVEAARRGKIVARLKGGDPMLFGRIAEEVAALESAGVPYEIVPGVTAASAASAYAGVPLTHRDHASCVAFVAGREGKDKLGDQVDMAQLARFPGTLVFYMGVTTAPEWSQALIDHGKAPETAAAIIRHCSLPEQETFVTTLGELRNVLAPGKTRPPAIIVVGSVVDARSTVDWFTTRPLFGKTVLVTRPEHQVDAMAERLIELGAAVLRQPAIEIASPRDWSDVDDAIGQIDRFDVIVFSSANGVGAFFQRIRDLQRDLRTLGNVQIAAIGPATRDKLSQRGLNADFVPVEYRAEALGAMLAKQDAGKRYLLIRASRGRETLRETLQAAGAQVRQVVVYESRDVERPDATIYQRLREGQIDWTTVTSSAIARSLVGLFGEELHKTHLAAISPLTAEVLQDAGFCATAVASEYTMDGLIDAIAQSTALSS